MATSARAPSECDEFCGGHEVCARFCEANEKKNDTIRALKAERTARDARSPSRGRNRFDPPPTTAFDLEGNRGATVQPHPLGSGMLASGFTGLDLRS